MVPHKIKIFRIAHVMKHREDEPEAGVDRIVFGAAWSFAEAVGNNPLVDIAA